MKDEMRMILAVGLIFLLLMVYPVYLKWVSPEKPAQPAQQNEIISDKYVGERNQVSPVETKQANSIQDKPVLEKTSEQAKQILKEELFDLETNDLAVTFSTVGGTIKYLEAKRFSKLHDKDAMLIDVAAGLRGSYAIVFPFEKSNADYALYKRDKTLEKENNQIAFTAVKDGVVKISKIFTLAADKSAISLDVLFENTSKTYQEINFELSTQLHYSPNEAEGYNRNSLEAGAKLDKKIKSKNIGHIKKKGFLTEGAAEWTFVSKKYFALITEPKETAFNRTRSIQLNENEITNFALSPKITLAPGAQSTKSFLLYTGAKEYNALKSYEQGFEKLLSKGFFGTFRIWLLLALQFLFKYLHNWGWAIVVITILIKLAFTPLTHMSFESMRKMSTLQPKIKAIQEKYKKDPQRMNKEVMAFYKENKVNPLGGCLPMLLQMPIFIAFYQVLYQAIELKGAPWIFWITDLSSPDKLMTLPFSLPFLGDGLNILPIIMLVSMIWQQKLTPMSGSPEQQKMMTFMPIIFGLIFYNLPSGLVLYWTVNNVLTILHQTVTKKWLPHKTEPAAA